MSAVVLGCRRAEPAGGGGGGGGRSSGPGDACPPGFVTSSPCGERCLVPRRRVARLIEDKSGRRAGRGRVGSPHLTAMRKGRGPAGWVAGANSADGPAAVQGPPTPALDATAPAQAPNKNSTTQRHAQRPTHRDQMGGSGVGGAHRGRLPAGWAAASVATPRRRGSPTDRLDRAPKTNPQKWRCPELNCCRAGAPSLGKV